MSTHALLQYVWPIEHTHDPAAQLAPGPHAVAHPPQWALLVRISIQSALHGTRVPSHAGPAASGAASPASRAPSRAATPSELTSIVALSAAAASAASAASAV